MTIELKLNTGTTWTPSAEQLAQWAKAYPAVSIERELEKAAAWLDANPSKRKTFRGVATFCINWLSKAQDKPGGSASGATHAHVEYDSDYWRHHWRLLRLAESELAGNFLESDDNETWRFPLRPLVLKVIADVRADADRFPSEYAQRSAVLGTLAVVLRQGWHA